MDKSFETLYKICMAMADTCLTDQTLPARFTKLEEEYQELIKAFADYDQTGYAEQFNCMIDEMADVLFVLLHAAHKKGRTPTDLLHRAATKMLARLNDPNYVAKEQRPA